MVLLAVGCVFAAISFLVYGLMNKSAPDTERRLATLAGERPRAAAVDEDALPSRLQVLAEKLSAFLPSTMLTRLAGLLVAANIRTSPEMVLVCWIGGAIGLPSLYLVMASQNPSGIGQAQEILGFGLFALCSYMPLVLIRGRVKKRRAKILKELPDMMDLLTTCVEAGLGIDAALAKVAEKAREPLAEEVRLILRTMAMGRPRREALEQFARRCALAEINSFTGAVIQAERMGVSLGQVLRVQSDALRVQRKQLAEQKAFKAPVKIIVVLALFIFPSMFVVIIGPAALPFIAGGS